jgi:hypothetical protein
MMPTIWPWRRAEERVPVRFFAETSADYPTPKQDMEIEPFQRDPLDDPTRCCERCEHLTGLIQQAGGARALDDALAAWFTAQMEAIHR